MSKKLNEEARDRGRSFAEDDREAAEVAATERWGTFAHTDTRQGAFERDAFVEGYMARAAVPDAATEPKNLSIMNGWLVEMVGKHNCGTGPDGHYGAHEPGCGYEPHLNLAELEGWPGAERDAALAAVERVRAIHRNAGPSQGYSSDIKGGYGMLGDCCAECGSHGEYGVEWPCPTIAALDGAPEPEWEYGVGGVGSDGKVWCDDEDELTSDKSEAQEWVEEARASGTFSNAVVVKRRVNPWLPVEGESKP